MKTIVLSGVQARHPPANEGHLLALRQHGRRARGCPVAWWEGGVAVAWQGQLQAPLHVRALMWCVSVPPSCVSSRGREVTPGLREVVLPHAPVPCSRPPEAQSGVAVSLQMGRVCF